MYHRYNVQQQPFIYLNIVTSRSEVDVNLTPDKRQLLLNNEKILLLALKKSLLDTFGSVPSTFQLQNVSVASMLKPKVEPTQEKEEEEGREEAQVERETKVKEEDVEDVPISSSQRFMDVLTQWRRTGDTKGVAPPVTVKRRCEETAEIATRAMKMQKIQEFLSQSPKPPKEYSCKSESDEEEEEKTVKESGRESPGGRSRKSPGESPRESWKDSPKQSPNTSFLNLKQLQAESKGKWSLCPIDLFLDCLLTFSCSL